MFPRTQRPTLTTHDTAGCCQEPLQGDDDPIARNLEYHVMLVELALQAGHATGPQLPEYRKTVPQPLRRQNRPHNPFNPQIRRQHPQTVPLPLVAAVSKLIHVADLHQSPWIALIAQRWWNRSHNSCTSI